MKVNKYIENIKKFDEIRYNFYKKILNVVKSEKNTFTLIEKRIKKK